MMYKPRQVMQHIIIIKIKDAIDQSDGTRKMMRNVLLALSSKIMQ